MNVSEKIHHEIYDLVTDFLNTVNQKDKIKLLAKFEVTDDMFEEILDYLDYIGELNLSPLPYKKTINHNIVNKPIFNIDCMNDGGYIVECNTMNFGKETEIVLQCEVDFQDGTYKLTLPLFKS